MTPSPDAARRVNEQIADDLQRDIDAGKYAPGSKLPAVRTIAERFAVAQGTASRALQLLALRGSIRADSTRGYFVCATAEDEEPESSPEFTALMTEIGAIRDHLSRLDDRLRQVERAQQSS